MSRRLPRGLLELPRCCGGGVLMEAALVWPMLLAVLFGAVELARLGWTQMALNHAVQEAARCADVRPDLCGSPAAIARRAREAALPLKVAEDAFSVSERACGTQVEARLLYAVTVGALAFPFAPVLEARVCRR